MLSRSASAAYLSAGTAPPSALAPPPEQLAWVEPYVAKSALQDLGKLSKLAKLLPACPAEAPVGEDENEGQGHLKEKTLQTIHFSGESRHIQPTYIPAYTPGRHVQS